MDRRGFLKSILALGVAPAIVRAGSLMPVVQTATGLLIPAVAVILWGDGVHDDQPGLQALLNGERVVRPDGSQVPNHQGVSRLIGGTYLVGSTINVNARRWNFDAERLNSPDLRGFSRRSGGMNS